MTSTMQDLCRAAAAVGLLIAPAAASVQAPAEPSRNAGYSVPPGDMAHPQNTNAGIHAFTGFCASCHDARTDGAPDRYELNRLTPEQVLATMTSASHAKYAAPLTEFEKRVIAVYVGGRPLGSSDTGDAAAMPNRCERRPAFEPFTGSNWNGWGLDTGNSRFQENPGLAVEDIPKLTLKWAFGFPMANSAYGQPIMAGGRVFVSADTGFVYSLDAASGCVYWSFRANAGVRSTPVIGQGAGADRYLLYFGDVRANVYAVNAETGALVWTVRADTHPLARITGATTLTGGRLYVPISSLEESGAGNPKYPCCTFRGGLASYEAQTGKLFWKSYTITEAPMLRGRGTTSRGVNLYGPAGAAVWSAPTVDLARGRVYVATGNGYVEPTPQGSDSIIAFDLDSGRRLWVSQVRADDAYVRDCPGRYRPNVPTTNKSETCPEELGPDVDFGNAPILRALSGGGSIIALGQKGGIVWGLDPDRDGEVVWSRLAGHGIDDAADRSCGDRRPTRAASIRGSRARRRCSA
ncbi:MAG: PQQ-binding-like beta-propeller repeat protein [Acidobacteria bacterium]|nr:PQQ-binding-like beta-propeller repeat protein [Acidobacteriota bacterium]